MSTDPTGDGPRLDRWGRESRLYADYRADARALLEADPAIRAARDEWAAFFTASHGDVFDSLSMDDPETTLFVDASYFDFVVDRILALAERRFGFAVTNREPGANTDALSFDFGGLHDRIADVAAVDERIESTLSRADLMAADVDFLRDLYERIVSREVRLALGEYYTPRGVAELAIESLDLPDPAGASFLDPGCGSGAFVAASVDATIQAMPADTPPAAVVDRVTSSVFGIDLNPVAVKSTKLAVVLSLLPALEAADVEDVTLPVFLADALRLTRDDPVEFRGEPLDLTVDALVGNPPWITWDRLDETVKTAWRERYVDDLDLFPHEGRDARLGHGNDDVSIPFVWVAIHRYLRENGRAAFVLKRDLMRGPAGKLLRTLSVNGRPLSLRQVHDFNALRPFGDQVGANAAIYAFEADTSPSFPVPAVSWTAGDGPGDYASAGGIRDALVRSDTELVPLEGEDPTSTWIRRDAERAAIGECDHEIRHGVKDDAAAVFGIDRAQLADLEGARVYPYLKSRHVVKYGLFGHDLRLVPVDRAGRDNEDERARRYPRTFEYLREHRDRLDDRASSWLDGGAFYDVFGLGEYTWADYKVVWCRLGFKPHFAVVSTVDDPDLGTKPVIPGDHFMFVGTDDRHEAHYLAALLNSAPYQRSLRDLASGGKASLSKSLVSKLALPEWPGTDRARRLAESSMDAHDAVEAFLDPYRNRADATIDLSKREYNRTTIGELTDIQARIDRLVERELADASGTVGESNG